MNFQIIFVALISVFAGVSFADVTCGPDDTYVVNPVDCGSFYQCANGVPFLLQCAPTHGGSLVFDPNLKVCVWPTDYDCRESVITTKPPESATDPSELTTEHPITEDSTIKPTEPSVTVPAADVSCGSDDTFVANPFDCSSYYQCVNGIPYLFQCAPIQGGSLVFDPNLKTCVWPTDYDCRESVITTKSPESTTEPSELTVEPSTAEPTVSTTERPITVPTTEPEDSTIKPTEPSVTVPAADVSCGSDDTFVANPVDCSSYYQCAHGIPYLFQCAPIQGGSLVFDPNLKTCVWPTDYDCRESVITTKSPESTTEPSELTVEPSTAEPTVSTPERPITVPTTEPEDSTIKPTEPSVTVPAADVSCGSDDTFVANPFDCSSYYQCVNGIPYLFQCAPIQGGSLVFDPNLKTCVWPTDYDCRESVITTKSPESTTEPSELTVEPSTAEPTVSTPERPITVPTTEPEDSTIKPTEPSVTVPAADVSCGSDDTFVANPVDCSSYYQCAHGIPYLFQCAPIQGGSLVFDPNLKTCVWPTDYDCRESVITTKSPESTAEPSEPTVTEPPETFEPCSDFSHPTSCLASPSHCSFCFDTHFKDDTPRCDSYDNLLAAGCHSFDVNRTEYDSIVVTNPNSTTWLPLEPGRKRNISITFSLEKHPLDLYYLMDFSGSMADDKANLIKLSSGLLDTLANLTDDYRIGFGTFVDKPILPFGVAGDYSFHNDFPISSKTDGLVQKITNLPIKGGKDAPEAHGDALAQVIECTEQIGWRDSARRVVLLATDIDFHIAGDGKRANINAPYVEGCYLDSLGAYTEELRMDYPSVEQLAKAYSKNQATTTVIFATSSGSVTFYRNVASQFKSAYVAVLNSDSSNVLELIKNEFAKIESRVEVEKSDTGDAVAFKFFSNCMSSTDERETTVCEHLPNSGDVTFTVEIDLAECPKDKDDTGMTFDLNPVGLPIFIEVELSYLCD